MIDNFDDIIKFENENTNLDFKAIQYDKPKFKSLLTDLISMANTTTDIDKHIIVGVKLSSNGSRDILGIKEDLIDEATYQQLATNNIEPELSISYTPYLFENKTLGIFTISNPIDKPYMMKKDYEALKLGDSFIRIGSHQRRLTRKDFDFYIEKKTAQNKFKGDILTYFDKINQKAKTYKILSKEDIPSAKEYKKIEKILLEKKDSLRKNPELKSSLFYNIEFAPFGNLSYENMSIEKLENKLRNVKENYAGYDLYYLLESVSNKINFNILNNGTEYLEDVTIEIKIDKKGIYIADAIHFKPQDPSTPYFEKYHYPKVKQDKTEYIIYESIGDLKHQISKKALESDLRISVIDPKMVEDERIVKIKIFAKNLNKPIEDELTINFLE